jgi:hypothetical protein
MNAPPRGVGLWLTVRYRSAGAPLWPATAVRMKRGSSPASANPTPVEGLWPTGRVGNQEDQGRSSCTRLARSVGDERAREAAPPVRGHGVDVLDLRDGALRIQLAACRDPPGIQFDGKAALGHDGSDQRVARHELTAHFGVAWGTPDSCHICSHDRLDFELWLAILSGRGNQITAPLAGDR